MQRPIEKFGWEYTGTYNSDNGLEECFETSLGHELRINNKGHILFLNEEAGFDFEVLQAIYETAKQIKSENEMEDKILCNRCENTCYYGFIECDNFKERKNGK